MQYQKPEMIDLSGLESFGECRGNGSGDSTNCYQVGNDASDICYDVGNTAGTSCDIGNGGEDRS